MAWRPEQNSWPAWGKAAQTDGDLRELKEESLPVGEQKAGRYGLLPGLQRLTSA